jgi:hypothetical protein
MGTVGAGDNTSRDGTGPNPGAPDWFQVTFSADTLTLAVTPANETGILFSVYTDCADDEVAGDVGLSPPAQEAIIATAGKYYVEVFPGASGTSAGTYELAASVS